MARRREIFRPAGLAPHALAAGRQASIRAEASGLRLECRASSSNDAAPSAAYAPAANSPNNRQRFISGRALLATWRLNRLSSCPNERGNGSGAVAMAQGWGMMTGW